jgi:dTDP-4-amino-4,6-dideoxy-D-galactose acyltransferase
MNYTHLDWDTNKFGYNVALINNNFSSYNDLELTLKELKSNKYILAYLFLNPENAYLNKIAMDLMGKFVDKKITFNKNSVYTNEKSGDFQIIPYNPSISLEEILLLSMESGMYSRFKVDSNFKNQEYEKLYSDWILNSISKKNAIEVLICIYENKVAGLITLGIKDSLGEIGLLAVNKPYRAKGIGKMLINFALNLFYFKKIKKIQVVTQENNIAACKLYKACGFSIQSKVNVYHFWF